MKININGRDVETDKTTLDYYEIDMLAHGRLSKPLQTIVYFGPRHEDMQRSGTITYNDPPIRLEEGMSITCTYTGNA